LQRFGQEHANIPLNDVFQEKGDTAAVWWEFLRSKYPKDQPPETMKRLRAVLEGKMPAKDFRALADEAVLLGRDLPEDRRARWFLAVADACKDAGADAMIKDCLEKAIAAAEATAKKRNKEDAANDVETSAALLRLADYHADKKEWTKAAELYGRIWALDKKEPLPAFLRGNALVEAGKEKEGKPLMELAHDLPLADAAARYRFARELDKRGFADAAREECELIVRINGYDEPWFAEEALKALAQYARAKKDYAKASDAYARALLCHLHAEAEYRFTAGNLVVPCSYHYNRALASLAAGKLDETKSAIQTCLTFLPGDINLAIYLLPDLEKQGHKKEAAELFDKVWAVHDALCKDHPDSAWAHNNLAWLSVRCRCNLDKGLKHSKIAVELSPDNAGYLDTLAEAHFQKGDKDRAIELIKKCISLDPKYAYFGRQLKRIEAGDPNVDVPE
jgi:tetratricopeptide (TPR) repeat protein